MIDSKERYLWGEKFGKEKKRKNEKRRTKERRSRRPGLLVENKWRKRKRGEKKRRRSDRLDWAGRERGWVGMSMYISYSRLKSNWIRATYNQLKNYHKHGWCIKIPIETYLIFIIVHTSKIPNYCLKLFMLGSNEIKCLKYFSSILLLMILIRREILL